MSRHGQGPTPPRREGLLLIAAAVSGVVMLAIGAFVVPIRFSDAHHAATARAIEASGSAPYPVIEVRQRVGYFRGWGVDQEVAEYRTPDGDSATVRLHGYDQSAVAAENEGWISVPGSSGDEVYISSDGRFGMLAADYRATLRGEFDGPYRVADAWVGGWVLLGLAALAVRASSQVRRGAATAWRAVLTPAVYAGGAVALLAVAYVLSFLISETS